MFEKFFRAERGPAARVGGTGLGLALAHEIVVAHGGRMGFESTEGSGSRVLVRAAHRIVTELHQLCAKRRTCVRSVRCCP